MTLVQAKAEADAKKHLKKFDEDPDLEIMNGRFGPYIVYKGSNYKLPKSVVPQDLTLDECLELVKQQQEKEAAAPAKPKRGRFAGKKK
jgi:DNA topoisomerase-1